jgi:hypothetical protein
LGFDRGTWDGCAGMEEQIEKHQDNFVKNPLRRVR